MQGYIFYNKQKLCVTDVSDFTDFQGIGSDPLYKRYDSVLAVIKSCIDEKYRSFVSQPVFNTDEGYIEWYVDKWEEIPVCFNQLSGSERARYQRIKDETINHYRNASAILNDCQDLQILGGLLRYLSDDKIFCYNDKVVFVAWGMKVDPNKHVDIGSVIHILAQNTYFDIRFDAGDQGVIDANFKKIRVKSGCKLDESLIPIVISNEGCHFVKWDPDPYEEVISSEVTFVAQYTIPSTAPIKEEAEPEKKDQYYDVHFNPGKYGTLNGAPARRLLAGTSLSLSMIPNVNPQNGYQFSGWDVNPIDCIIDKNMSFTAQYEKKTPWYKRLRWLWGSLLGLLLFALLFLLLRSCIGCRQTPKFPPVPGLADAPWITTDPNVGDSGGIYDPGNPYTPIVTPPEYIDVLPPEAGVLPPISEDDRIISKPGEPEIIENRLNILMENKDKSIMDLARDFKQKYPSDDYKVVYYDDVIKRMQIVVPNSEREVIKDRLPEEFAPEYELFVFDESMFESNVFPTDPEFSSGSKIWYFNAINAFLAWDISMGSDSITVAVVDNGFNLKHKEFQGKVVMPYNVWNHNGNVYCLDEDHGTHVASTAIGLSDNNSGLCGIAPKCKFMPIQVADDQGRMTISSVLDGIIYAIYQGANVVNVSLGSTFDELAQFPESVQRELIYNHFKEEERLWREISRIADSHNVTVVVAAGNDNVLAGIEALQRPNNFIVVSALDKKNKHYRKTNFSNYGEYSTISAPGVDIYSAYKNGYKSLDGTSMATPIVTGAVALIKSLNKNLTNEQIICILQSTAKSVDDKIGFMLQLDKALLKVKNNQIDDCQMNQQNLTPSNGDVEVTLHWNNTNDLDIACLDPNYELIMYNHRRSVSGGFLEFDMNSHPDNLSNSPVEHIYWPQGSAPNGTYKVYLTHYRKFDSEDNSAYSIEVKFGKQKKTFTGNISHAQGRVAICSFTLNENDSGDAVQSDETHNSGVIEVNPVQGVPDEGSSNNNNSARRRELIQKRDQLRRQLDEVNNELNNL